MLREISRQVIQIKSNRPTSANRVPPAHLPREGVHDHLPKGIFRLRGVEIRSACDRHSQTRVYLPSCCCSIGSRTEAVWNALFYIGHGEVGF